jgi:hypothetical protein
LNRHYLVAGYHSSKLGRVPVVIPSKEAVGGAALRSSSVEILQPPASGMPFTRSDGPIARTIT